jgi:hypothetical protein
LVPGPSIHPDFSALAALPASDEHRAAGRVQIALLKCERFADSQASSPQQHYQGAEAMALGAVADRPHHGDDLLDRRRVSRMLLTLVARQASAVVARHGHARAAVSSGVQQHGFHESSLVDGLN